MTKVTIEIDGTKYSIEQPEEPVFQELMEVYLVPLLKVIYSNKTVDEYFK